MRYDEKEEIEATGEWLLRIGNVGFSEDLMYVPSELTKMGVTPPPVDVVDRLNKLRASDHAHDSSDHGIVEVVVERASSSVLLLERPKTVEQEAAAIVEMVVEVVPLAEPALLFDYDSFGPWEWAEPLERMLEDSIRSVLAPEPGLHVFNELASLTQSIKRGKGKRARSSAKSIS